MKRLIKSLIVFSCLFGALSYNHVKAAENITVKGSDTMVVLGQRLAEEYMKKNKDVSIQVTGGGSGTGIAALLNNTTNLANSSRPIKDVEAKK
ncbi:MAG: substrate-binding domain-containing protein, partial [Candidatus Brocadiales bacterium]|nr:substrate-binding domain-containing protein [Candidatus Brocadiales bacterium]